MRLLSSPRMRTALNCLLLLTCMAAFETEAASQGAEVRNKVMARVDIGSGGGGPINVIFNLYRVQSSCCDPCRIEPRRPCRMCCPLLMNAPDYSVTLSSNETNSGSSELKFENIDPGTYLLVNKVDGVSAGLELFVKVEEDSKINLGKIAVDNGRPRSAAGDRLPPREN